MIVRYHFTIEKSHMAFNTEVDDVEFHGLSDDEIRWRLTNRAYQLQNEIHCSAEIIEPRED